MDWDAGDPPSSQVPSTVLLSSDLPVNSLSVPLVTKWSDLYGRNRGQLCLGSLAKREPCRQLDFEPRSGTGLAGGVDATAVGLHDLAGDEEAEPETSVMRARDGALESTEDSFQVAGS